MACVACSQETQQSAIGVNATVQDGRAAAAQHCITSYLVDTDDDPESYDRLDRLMHRAFAAEFVERNRSDEYAIIGAVYSNDGDGGALVVKLRHRHGCDALKDEDSEFLSAIEERIDNDDALKKLGFHKTREENVPANSTSWEAH
jgi:hypothetical protein